MTGGESRKNTAGGAGVARCETGAALRCNAIVGPIRYPVRRSSPRPPPSPFFKPQAKTQHRPAEYEYRNTAA
jgi:hypothetical protein